MTLDQFFIMQHEILLIAAVLIILVADLFVDEKDRNKVNNIAIATFMVITLVGFYPYEGGKLFGNMYIVDDMRLLMKNILNLSVLVIFFQSSEWILKLENRNKLSEFYILIISALIGMQYMISSGHFLMFYLGLELATIPVAALAAYERFNSKSAEAGIKLILSSAFSSGVLLFGLTLIYADQEHSISKQ